MKNLKFLNKMFCLLLALSASIVIFNSCDDDSEPSGSGGNTNETGVVINGVTWATRNVDMPGTFAATPETAGMFYQWNRKTGWSSIDPMINSNGGTIWNGTMPEGTEWTRENDPSPTGWCVPTLADIEKLLDTDKVSSIWTTQRGVYGRKFTDRNTGRSLFLPAAGCRTNDSGTMDDVGTHGYYWSSTA